MNDGFAVRFQEPLARHTPARTGGPCDAWVVVHRPEGLPQLLSECRREGWKVTLIGAGTRTIFRDGPVAGVVARLGTGFAEITALGDGRWRVGGAAPMPALHERLAAMGHGGLEPLAGVVGTVGASVWHDPGWSEVVESVRTVIRDKYREVPLEEVAGRKGRLVAEVVLRFRQETEAKVRKRLAKQRERSRPGAWYRPVPKGDLREVLRTAQLPMVRLRRVAIPDAAPELLVNLGGGTAEDLALLYRSATERVKRVRGVELEPAVRWVGTREDHRG